MDIEKAAVLEGMVMGARGTLLTLADHIREAVPPERRRDMVLKVGAALASLGDISRMIYEEHSVLNPFVEEERLAAEMRAGFVPTDKSG